MTIDVAHRSDRLPGGAYQRCLEIVPPGTAIRHAKGFRATANWPQTHPQDRLLALARAAFWQSIADARS
jgi:hypothetical protein